MPRRPPQVKQTPTTRARLAGAKAHADGGKPWDNPYPEGNLHRAFEKGWWARQFRLYPGNAHPTHVAKQEG